MPVIRPRRLLEVVILAVESLGEDVRVVEDEVEVLVGVDGARRGGHRDVAGRLAAREVVKLMPRVGRQGEVAVLVPLEGALPVLVDPDGGGPLTLQNVDNLVVDVLDRIERLTGSDLAHVRVVEPLRAVQVDEQSGAATRRPRGQLDVVEVDSHAPNRRHAL
jgi:hypothetical protein